MRFYFQIAKEDGRRWFITDKHGDKIFQYVAICRIDDQESTASLLQIVFFCFLFVVGWNRKPRLPNTSMDRDPLVPVRTDGGLLQDSKP
jgi:hypothetical protein